MQTQEHQGPAASLLRVLPQPHTAAELPGQQQRADYLHFSKENQSYSQEYDVFTCFRKCLLMHILTSLVLVLNILPFVFVEPEFHRFQEDSEEA